MQSGVIHIYILLLLFHIKIIIRNDYLLHKAAFYEHKISQIKET